VLQRVDFDPQQFIDLINTKGLNLLWEKQIPCPCVDPTTRQAVADCNVCDGTGRYYYTSSTIRGLINREQKQPDAQHNLGILNLGEAYLTVEHVNFMSLFDRITNIDSQVIFNDMVLHTNNVNSGDWLSYTPVGNVLYAVTSTAKNTVTPLVQGTDYTLGTDGKITWVTETVSTEGQAVSFRYMTRPTWIVMDTPNYIRDTFVKFNNPTDEFQMMPVRFMIKLEFLGGNGANAGASL